MQRILFVLPTYHFYPDRLGYGERFGRMARERIGLHNKKYDTTDVKQ